MRGTLAITAAALALSLAACGAQNGNPGAYGTAGDSVGATDTMHNKNGTAGTGTVGGATANAATAAEGALESVTGAVNRAATRNDDGGARYGFEGYSGAVRNAGRAAKDGVAAPEEMTNAMTRQLVDYSDETAVRRAADAGDNYARMLENGRVHDRDGFLFDGENAHYRTF